MPKDFLDPNKCYSRIEESQPTKLTQLWSKRKPKWNGDHQLLPTDSPTISASTTATNLSDFQSSSTINTFFAEQNKHNKHYLTENIRRTNPEIEPLKSKNSEMTNININTAEGSLEECQKRLSVWQIRNQVITAIAVSLVSLIIGYTSGYTSPAEISLKKDLNISGTHFSAISGLMPLTAVAGGLLGGPFIDILGRKWTILVTNVLFLVGWSIICLATNYVYLYVSRAICGIAVGIASLVLPVYLSETIQPEVRGTLGLLPTAFGNIGILFCYSMGLFFEWNKIAIIGFAVCFPFLFLIWIIPETPRWFITKQKTKESRKALEWLRGASNTEAVEKELQELNKSQESQKSEKSDSVCDLFTVANVKSLAIVLGLMFFQQMSGINAIIFYTTQIFEDTQSDIPSSIQTIIVGGVNFVSTFIATILIDRLGRKILLYISSSAMIVTLAALGAYFYILTIDRAIIEPYNWIPLASVVIYVLGFSLGFGPIPWLMMGEILPSKIRGPAASVSTAFNWTCTSIVTITFDSIKDMIGAHGVFWLFCGIVTVGFVFIILFVPETKGQSLEDIERKLNGVKVRKMSSVANMKPLPNGV